MVLRKCCLLLLWSKTSEITWLKNYLKAAVSYKIVEGVCGVCVVDGWFTASPGLSQTDWTLAGWGCTPGVHEQSWHPG